MTQEKFKEQIEKPLSNIKNFISGDYSTIEFWAKIHIKSAINKTARLTLKYPELAQQYLNQQPKAICDDNT
jgi:hypothetical protein